MCLKNRIQQTLAEIAEKQERLAKLQSLEQKTNPTMQALYDLLEMYREVSPSDMPDLIGEITKTCHNYQKLIASRIEVDSVQELTETQCQQQVKVWEKEEIRPGLKKLYQEAEAEPEYEPDEAYDTVESVLSNKGFYAPDVTLMDVYNEKDKQDSYKGWDIYCSVHDHGAAMSIGLSNDELEQFWDVGTEFLGDHDSTFPKSVYKKQPILAWARSVIDLLPDEAPILKLEPEVPGQLALEFPESESETVLTGDEYDAAMEEELALDDDSELTKWHCKFDGKKWEVSLLKKSPDGTVSFLFQASNEGFTGHATLAELEECNNSITACADKILTRKFAKIADKPENEQTLPELTNLQKLLVGNSNFTFEDLGVSVAVESVFTEEEETEEENEEDSGEPDIVEVEEARFTVSNAEGKTKEYYRDAEQLVRGSQRLTTIVKFNAEQYAKKFLQDLKKDAETKGKIARWNADETLQSNQQQSRQSVEPIVETEVETVQPQVTIDNFLDFPINTMGVQVQVYPQYAGENNLMGVTFRFLSLEEKGADGKPKVVYSKSLLAAELGDRNYKLAAIDLIQNWQNKETARLEKLANPYAKEEDKFVEMVKISNDVGYLKEKATGKILKGYAAFSNKKNDGSKTETQAKARAAKWAEWLKGTFDLECDAPRIAKRIISENSKQPFAYEVKILNPSIGQLTKLAEEDLSLLPLEREDKQNRAELRNLELKNDTGSDETKAAEKVTEPEPLTDNEIKIVELIRAALSKFNTEAVQEINSAEVPELVRNKVWEALSAVEQKVYELLLKLEFVQAPDFSVQTPEFTTSVDGKQGKSVFLSLRAIDGVPSRVWRYQGQTGDGGYPCKEAAAVAAWLQ